MIDRIHRILSGSPEHRTELIAAGIFVAIWFTMDAVQWVDWLAAKMQQPPQMACVPIHFGSFTLPNGNPLMLPGEVFP